jgi:DNA primase
MTDAVQEIKERINLVEFLRSYIQLLPAGKNFKALCPFHKEKTPSFMVSPERQVWRCFGCGEHGDIFTFLMKYENLEFYEALRLLADRAGVELQRLTQSGEREFNVLFEANAAAAEYFKRELKNTPAALEYLKRRGLKAETIEEFGLGFAPDQNAALILWLRSKGIRPEDAMRAGLALKNDRGLYVDRFRGRIMFPIANHVGKIVGFTGRILPVYESSEIGKYVNTPETAIFTKSRILYGFYRTKGDIRNVRTALLVEGQMDFLMVWQDGIKNVVATSGTALTSNHLATLRRFAGQIIICFDADEAGGKAGERAIDLANAFDFSVRVLTLPDSKDPADYVMTHPGEFKKLIEKAYRAMEFYFERYGFKEKREMELETKKKMTRAILGKIKNISSSIEKGYWIRELSKLSGFSERALIEEMESLAAQMSEQPNLENATVPATFGAFRGGEERFLTRRERIAERLLSLAVSQNFLADLKAVESFLPPLYRKAYRELLYGKEDKSLASSRSHELAELIELRSGLDLRESKDELLKQLKKEYLKERQEELARKISEAERSGNETLRDELMRELAETAKEMHTT